MRLIHFALSAAVLAASFASLTAAQGTKPPAADAPKPQAPAAKAPAPKGGPYTLDTCPVSGEKLGAMGAPVVKQYDGREVRFCCNSCVKPFEEKQAEFIAKIDEQIVKQQLAHYPLKNCVVMEDDILGDNDTQPVNFVYGNRLVRFCCSNCIKDFNAEPEKFIKKIDTAVIAEQKPDYPLTTCPISGETLEGASAPVDYVASGLLIRFCCKGCVAKFEADPLPVVAKLHDAWTAKSGKDHDEHDHSHEGHDHSDPSNQH